MDEQDVRARADALCAALVTGDMEAVTADFSPALRRNLGEVLALLPLPSREATIESLDRGGGSAYTIVLRLVGDIEEVLLQTRWKARDGRPTVIEASHLPDVPEPTEAGGSEVQDESPPGG